jgi:Skp family chaperone for outer membrane proteins
MASIREQVENLRAAYQEEIATLERQLREERQFLDGDRGTLSSEEREVRERTFESKEEHLRQLVRRLKTQLERALESAKEEFLKHFQSVVSQIARTHHLSLVVIKSAAPYASEECDITRQVLERLDATAQPITLSPTKEEKVEKSSP